MKYGITEVSKQEYIVSEICDKTIYLRNIETDIVLTLFSASMNKSALCNGINRDQIKAFFSEFAKDLPRIENLGIGYPVDMHIITGNAKENVQESIKNLILLINDINLPLEIDISTIDYNVHSFGFSCLSGSIEDHTNDYDQF